MDWAKAKTILIIVLLALCLVLTGVLVARDLKMANQIAENKEAALSYLDSLGVVVEAEIPTKRVKLPVLFVEYNSARTDLDELTYKKYLVYTNDVSSSKYIITAEGEKTAEVMPASSAIVEAASRFSSQDLRITGVTLCYYIDNNAVSVSNGSSDTAFPAWRVETSAGSCFVLAY